MKTALTQSEYSRKASHNHIGRKDLVVIVETSPTQDKCEHMSYCELQKLQGCSHIQTCHTKRFYDKYGNWKQINLKGGEYGFTQRDNSGVPTSS